MTGLRRSRLGLRARVTVAFSVGALVLSASVAGVAYDLIRHNVLQERERSAVRAAYYDAVVVQQGLGGENAGVVDALRSLDSGQARRPLIRRDGQWFARNADDGLTTAIPARLLRVVGSGSPAVQRIRVAGQPALVVGVPLRRGNELYDVQSLTEAAATLRTVALGLAAAAAAATVAAAALGRWAARRLLAPLRQATAAAAQVSAGDLSVQMEPAGDPDLAPLTSSFNAMVHQLRDRVEQDQRFAADVSHELRSPLQTLAAASEVLGRRAPDLDDRSAAAAALVAEETERFTALVTGLLELAKQDETASLAQVDVGELLSGVARRKHLSPELVVLELPPGTTWPMDRRRIDVVLDNLVDNACKHGGGVVRLTARTGAPGDDRALRLEVDDAGPGVAPDERAVVFDRFARGRIARARGAGHGTGLGLSIAARQVAVHGGRLHVEDRPGGGARFVLELAGPG